MVFLRDLGVGRLELTKKSSFLEGRWNFSALFRRRSVIPGLTGNPCHEAAAILKSSETFSRSTWTPDLCPG
jgi:hypothetical protein